VLRDSWGVRCGAVRANWAKPGLLRRAREIGIKGRSTMTKAELIKALRNH